MAAPAPSRVSFGDPSRARLGQWNDLEFEPVDDRRDGLEAPPTAGDDQCLGERPSRNRDLYRLFERGDAGSGARFVKDDRNQRRSVDNDHLGRPSSS